MKNNKTLKIFLTILALGFVFWFGGTVLRTMVALDIFEPVKGLPLKEGYSDSARFQTVYLFTNLSLYTNIGYLAVLIGAIYVNFFYKNKLKSKGWLFMALVLFYISVPVEAVKMYYDAQLTLSIYYDNVNEFFSYDVKKWFVQRFQSLWLQSLGTISILANLTALLYVIWQPLNKEQQKNK